MSQNNKQASAGFSHEKIETNNFLMIVLILLVIAIGGLVEIVPLFFQKSTTEAVKGVEPYTATQLIGRDVYIREGCYNCHSQMIRPFRAETLRYGHYSVAGEFVYDHTPSSGAASAQVLTCIAWAASTATNGIAST
jgi:cytochrome c oxidase cbb3-type subunit 2